jgi:hypothetical protein
VAMVAGSKYTGVSTSGVDAVPLNLSRAVAVRDRTREESRSEFHRARGAANEWIAVQRIGSYRIPISD